MIHEINLVSYQGKTFEEVLSSITKHSQKFSGIGPLSIYDISSGISRWNAIPINRVYIVGDGPKNAAKLLNLRLKRLQIDSRVFHYAEQKDVIEALQKRNVEISADKMDGDSLETFLCKWQKSVS